MTGLRAAVKALDRFEARVQNTAYWRDGHYVNSNGSLLTDLRETRDEVLAVLAAAPAAPEQAVSEDVIAGVLNEHVRISTAGMAGESRPHFWMCACRVYGYGKRGEQNATDSAHRAHVAAAIAAALATKDGAL